MTNRAVAAVVAGTVVALASGAVSPAVSVAAISSAFQIDLKYPVHRATEAVTTADVQAFAIGSGFLDIVVAADGTVMSVGFVPADGASVAEADAKIVGSSVSDAVTVAEADTKTVTIPAIADGASVAEADAKVAAFPESESVVTCDIIALAGQVVISDTLTAAEADTKAVTVPAIADGASVAEAPSLEPQIPVADGVSVAEASSLEPQVSVGDSVTVAEAAVKAIGALAAETISVADDAVFVAQTQLPLADGASIADAPSLESQVPVSEAVTAAEVDTKNIQPEPSDTASIVDVDTPRVFTFTTVEGNTGLIGGEGVINDLVVNDDTLTGTNLPVTPFSTVLQSVSQLNGGLVNFNVINL